MTEVTVDDVVAALVVLAEAGIPPDMQELLVRGDPSQGIKPNALYNCLDALRSSLKEVREENDRLKGERDESSRAWRDSFNSMHQRAMNAEASCEAMAKALEPFSKFAGIVFERIFNNQDPVDTMTAVDGRQVTLHASDFFRVRAALDAYRKEKGE